MRNLWGTVLAVAMMIAGASVCGVARADIAVPVTYRVTLQVPGPPQQAEISYRTGDNPDGGDAWAKDVVTLQPFVPWERQVTMQTRWASAYPMVSVFSVPGGQYFGEIVHGGTVVASGSATVGGSSDAPAGTPVILARATVS